MCSGCPQRVLRGRGEREHDATTAAQVLPGAAGRVRRPGSLPLRGESQPPHAAAQGTQRPTRFYHNS